MIAVTNTDFGFELIISLLDSKGADMYAQLTSVTLRAAVGNQGQRG